MIWLSQGVELLIGVALLGAGVTAVRVASAKAGWTMAVAGLLQLLSVCCLAGVRVATDRETGSDFAYSDEGMMTQGFSWLGASLVDVVSAILVALALVMLARAVRASAPQS